MQELSLDYLIRYPKTPVDNPPLLILLHGYGSNEQDLFSFSEELPDEFLIVSAKAPLTIMPGSYAWYSIYFDAADGKFSDVLEAKKSRDLIAKFIDEIKKSFKVNKDKTFLLGFSQGTILSYAVALNYPDKVNYIVALSGYINEELLPEDLDKEAIKELVFFISHGSVDQVLPADWGRKAKPFLDTLGVENIYREYPVGHGVAPQNFYDFTDWIKKRL